MNTDTDTIYVVYNTNADSWSGMGYVVSYHRTEAGALEVIKNDTGPVDFLAMETEPSSNQATIVRDFVYFQIRKIDLLA